MNPGATMQPSASSTRSPLTLALTSVTRPAAMPTSARTPGPPLPSTTVPPRMTSSFM